MGETLSPRTGRLLTIAIPYYSGVELLRRAVDSVLRQTSPHWRLLVVDDSPAGTPPVPWPDLGGRDPRIRYERNRDTLGMAGNWNRCLNMAETDLVALLHADDELLPNYVGLMIQAAARWPEAVALFCQEQIIDEHSRRRFSFPDAVKRLLWPRGRGPVRLEGESGIYTLLCGNIICCPTLCYRKSLLAGRRFAPSWRFALDLEFTTRLLLEGETLVGLREMAYAYRRHAGNATVRFTENLERFREEAQLLDALRGELAARGWQRAASIADKKWIIKLNLGYCMFMDVISGRPRRALDKLGLLRRLR